MKTTNTPSTDINWNYLAYLCIMENEKWSNYAGSIPGTPLYAKFCYCAVNTIAVVCVMENVGLKDIEPEYLDSQIAKYNIGITAILLREKLSEAEAAQLLSSEYNMKRKAQGVMAAYLSSDFFLTEEEISRYDAAYESYAALV